MIPPCSSDSEGCCHVNPAAQFIEPSLFCSQTPLNLAPTSTLGDHGIFFELGGHT